jgi:hypothetical protein
VSCSSLSFTIWCAVPAWTWAIPPTGISCRLGRVAQVQRHRPADRNERLVLHGLDVPRALRAGFLADEVGARVTEPGGFGELSLEPPWEALVFVPLEPFAVNDVKSRHGVHNGTGRCDIPIGA